MFVLLLRFFVLGIDVKLLMIWLHPLIGLGVRTLNPVIGVRATLESPLVLQGLCHENLVVQAGTEEEQ